MSDDPTDPTVPPSVQKGVYALKIYPCSAHLKLQVLKFRGKNKFLHTNKIQYNFLSSRAKVVLLLLDYLFYTLWFYSLWLSDNHITWNTFVNTFVRIYFNMKPKICSEPKLKLGYNNNNTCFKKIGIMHDNDDIVLRECYI